MARIRSIKPDFWTSEQVMECSLPARLLFIGMWNFADDSGRILMSAKTLKAQIFPSDDLTSENILGMVGELSGNGLVVRYEVEGRQYLQITGWQHQRIDKPQPSKYPAPVADHSKNDPGTFPPDRKGEDRKGKEKRGEGEARSREDVSLSLDFEASAGCREKITAMGFAEPQFNSEFSRFVAYYMARGTKRADWDAALISWFQRASPDKSAKALDAAVFTIEDAVKQWARLGRWPRGLNFGPEPGMSGCLASVELLAKYGLAEDGRKLAAVAA